MISIEPELRDSLILSLKRFSKNETKVTVFVFNVIQSIPDTEFEMLGIEKKMNTNTGK